MKYIVYNNSLFNSPIEVSPDEIMDDDMYLLTIPVDYTVPRNVSDVAVAILQGYQFTKIEINDMY